MAGRAAEGLLPGSLATGRPPAWGLNSVSAVSGLTLADFVSQPHWSPGESCTYRGRALLGIHGICVSGYSVADMAQALKGTQPQLWCTCLPVHNARGQWKWW